MPELASKLWYNSSPDHRGSAAGCISCATCTPQSTKHAPAVTAAVKTIFAHADRLRAQGLLTATQLAQRLEVHRSTVKNWTKAGILNSHKANDKNERLYQPPIPGHPSLTTRQGSPLRKRVPTQPTTGGAL